MVACKAVVSIPYQTGIPGDVAVNVWSFEVEDDTTPNFSEIGAFIYTFYNEVTGFYSPVTSPTNSNLKIYVRSDAEPQLPRVDAPIDLGAPSSVEPLPEEVAFCCSFRGVLASGTNPRRRRGRVYLGPLTQAVVAVGANSRTEVGTGFRTVVEEAIQAANAELTTAGNFHTVWSQTDEVNVTVTDYWVDNAFDTQRRRGVEATSRNNFPPLAP